MARRLGDVDMGQRSIDRLLAIPTFHLVNLDHDLGVETGRLAARYRLRGADAFYVAVAARLQVPLISWDCEQIGRVTELIATYTPAQAAQD